MKVTSVYGSLAAEDKDAFSSLGIRADASNGRTAHWPYITGLLCAVVLAFGWYFYYDHFMVKKDAGPLTNPPVEQHNLTAVKLEPQPVPDFIRVNGLDPLYEKSNPGWTRYLGSECEFLVFTDKGVNKAYQIIARKDSGIPEDLVRQLLRELTGSDTYSVSDRREKDGFLLESWKQGARCEVLLYRKKVSGVLRAVVLELH